MRSLIASRTRCARALAGLTIAVTACAAHAADWIVSGNDGKYQRVEGRDTYPANPQPDTLTLLDASHFPPQVKVQVEVENGIQGPPQAVAITPDASVALVAAPTRYDHAAKKLLMDTFVQVVDLKASPPAVSRLDIGSHPQGIAIDRSRPARARHVRRRQRGGARHRGKSRDAAGHAEDRAEAARRRELHARRPSRAGGVARRTGRRRAGHRRRPRHRQRRAPVERRGTLHRRRIERRQMGGRERCRTGRAAVLRGQARGRRRHDHAHRRLARAVPRGSARHGAVAARRRGDLARRQMDRRAGHGRLEPDARQPRTPCARQGSPVRDPRRTSREDVRGAGRGGRAGHRLYRRQQVPDRPVQRREAACVVRRQRRRICATPDKESR